MGEKLVRLLICVGALGWMGCTVPARYVELPITRPGPAEQSFEAEMIIRELAARNFLVVTDSVAFLYFATWEQDRGYRKSDPPQEFLDGIADLGVIWIPGSRYWDWINERGGGGSLALAAML